MKLDLVQGLQLLLAGDGRLCLGIVIKYELAKSCVVSVCVALKYFASCC